MAGRFVGVAVGQQNIPEREFQNTRTRNIQHVWVAGSTRAQGGDIQLGGNGVDQDDGEGRVVAGVLKPDFVGQFGFRRDETQFRSSCRVYRFIIGVKSADNGLAIDGNLRRFFVVGVGGKMVLQRTGHRRQIRGIAEVDGRGGVGFERVF